MPTTAGLDNAHAETIVELFNQLRAQGYSGDDLRLIHRAYGLAAPLYTCHYRSSGRSLTHHAVGTTSIVAALAVPTPLVAAMLLHAV
jgi:(p)ppGpp synthase/HD superfamily hydrolase